MPESIIYTTIDKAKRDELFHELRTRGRGVERQAVKFSGVQPVLDSEGKQAVRRVVKTKRFIRTQKFDGVKGTVSALSAVEQFIPLWQSNWSVAHPAEIDTLGGE